ncbi:MAG: hypothetical protein WC644_13260 [Ignavibacteria bacterium]
MNKMLISIIFVLSAFNIAFPQSGKLITYVSDDNPSGYFQVFVMNEDGSEKKQLSDMLDHCYFPSLSSDDKKVVFNTESGIIYYIDNIDQETPSQPIYVFTGEHASFANDDQTIIFNSDFEGVLTIYAIELGLSEPFIISDLGYSNQQLLSKDGTKIVFSSFYQGGKDVILIDFSDTTDNNVYKISNNNHANLFPDISSDNMLITWAAFDNNLQGTINILNDGNEIALSKGVESANRPKFSPDVKKIAFVAITDTKTKIYTMDIDGSNKKSFDIKGGNVANYQWLDSERIVYDAENGNEYNIGILDVTSGNSKILTNKNSSMHPHSYIK